MKKAVVLLIVGALTLFMVACGSAGGSGGSALEQEKEVENNGKVTTTDYVNVEGLYVDSSYTAESNPNYRFFYIVYSVFTNAENLSVDSKSMQVTINGINTYQAVREHKEVQYMRNYNNSAYLKNVNLGDEVKIVETFQIPEAELASGRTLEFSKSQIPDMDKIQMTTDDIVFCNSPEEVAQLADPEGYEKETWALQDADESITQAVMAEVNGYQWDVNVDSLHFAIEFWAPNEFEVRSGLGANQGSYTVKNGYIECVYYNGVGKLLVPYTIENGSVKVDAITAFDFNK